MLERVKMTSDNERIKALEEIIEILVLSIPREVYSQKHYHKAAQSVSTKAGQEFFRSLVEEEMRHEANLKAKLEEFRQELKELKGKDSTE